MIAVAVTAAMIDSRDFIAAKRKADTEVMLCQPAPRSPSPAGLNSTTIS
jgi:hypothetical protein